VPVETQCCSVAHLLAPARLTIESQAEDASDDPDNVRIDDRCRFVAGKARHGVGDVVTHSRE